MNHNDHVRLLQNGVPHTGGVWADLGAGEGAFTLALAELIGPSGTIYAVDRDGRALQSLEKTMRRSFPQITLHTIQADFTRPLALPPLDGVVMANSLHFVAQKGPVLQQVKGYLKEADGRLPDGRLLIVEYNSDQSNHWVPYPFSYQTWVKLAQQTGFRHTEQLATYPSRFLHEIYAALSR
ncbi:MAG TPA: class I SAM-dependent methyltransferase [Chloroflexota bacterium]|nr:class I SAM-dependent methyltransferase [Chloroflexota bacterium]HUM68384.1 class I SAM-dependent methyltransferase [Chloroflexota bacterium]